MDPVRRAVIDVGTNSIKLLVAEVAGHDVRPVWEESKQTRLGRGLYQTRHLQPDAIAASARAVADFAAAARQRQAASVRVIATSAARDALNSQALTSAIQQASGLEVEIISGEREADLVFQGVTTDPELARAPLLLLDVGGGSTEFILGQGERKHFRQSFPLGTVRLLENFPPSDPPEARELIACRHWLEEFLGTKVEPELKPALQEEARACATNCAPQLVGASGTATILACMEARLEAFERARIDGLCLSLERVRWHVEHLWSLPLDRRRQVVGLPKNRADVILMGAAIYEAILERFGFPSVRITTRGLRFAAVLEEA